jgi:hypothetical protein
MDVESAQMADSPEPLVNLRTQQTRSRFADPVQPQEMSSEDEELQATL